MIKNIIIGILLVILLIWMIGICFKQNIIKYNNKKTDKIEVFDNRPDMPKQFGYKISWIVIKTDDLDEVITKLNLTNRIIANWSDGINAVYSKKYVFITPVIDGYICIIANDLIGQDKIVKKITSQFKEAFLCQSNRTIDLYCWQKYINGEMSRNYCYMGESGTVISEGVLTAEELNLGFDNFPQNDDEMFGEKNVKYPAEEDVINISKEWGFDTRFEDYSLGLTTGYVYSIDLFNE